MPSTSPEAMASASEKTPGQVAYEARFAGKLGPRGLANTWDNLGPEGRAIWERVASAVAALDAPPPVPDSGRVAEGISAILRGLERVRCAGGVEDAESAAMVLGHAVDTAIQDLRALDAAPAPAGATGEGRERVRHVKRGTEYEVLGEAEVQVSWSDVSCRAADDPGAYRTLHDGDFLTVYRCLTTGKLWCRFTDEFRGGRFQPAPSPAGEA